MKSLMKLVLAATLVCGLALLGNAATISYTDYVPGPTATGFSPLNFGGQFILPQFNPILGTLTGVQITYLSEWTNVTGTHTNNGAGIGSARLRATFDSFLTGATINNLFEQPVIYDTGTQIINPGGSISVPGQPLSGSSPTYNVSIAAALASFVGTGDLTFDLLAFFTVSNTFSGTFSGGQDAEGRGQLTITYTYDEAPNSEIPEPATMGLMGGGLLLLGLASRLRRR